ncbi:hypothetical protein BT63DRAFT_280466 [Microthyrium microscopicum]|uniref:DUF7082 domain-containing protein n=1 Tax=Microthyrium microscopicum TaxID=703497 RepID=A0A6A6UAV1_9PEZI|nr:hypothetical protein BT63DRAFT_280466 [Microthyrium microscopicum]
MSGYEKSQESYVNDYDPTTRPSQGHSYGGYAQPSPSFDPHSTFVPTSQASEPHGGLPHANQMPFLGTTFAPRDQAFHHTPAPFMDARSRNFIELTSTGPYHGDTNEILRIEFKSQIEYTVPKYTFYFVFGGTSKVRATLAKDFYQEPYHHFSLTSTVPALPGASQGMPLMIDMQDENALSLEQKNIGMFFYGAGYYPEDRHSVPLQEASPYPSSLFALPASDRTASQRSQYGQASAMRPQYGYSMSPSLAPQSLRVRSPGLTNYGSYPPMAHTQSPQISTQPAASVPLSRSVSTSSEVWVRTSELRQHQSAPTRAYGTTPQFNPYAQYPDTKARLEIIGDLATMCHDWTDEEKSASRRIVEFQRTQIGSTITATFSAVSLEERSPNNPCISCIYWEKKDKCYVTSVDTIALLEGLVAVRFTVEEKNRIRRNLEGFKPYTVSKNKDECDDIFRLIMGFPSPKPRNIEKDIKIFPWSILSQALRKIIGKYSASYASTSSVLGTPQPSTAMYGTTLTETSEHQHPTASPASATSSTVPAAYAGGMTSTALSPRLPGGSAGLEITASSHDLRGSSSMPQLLGHGGPSLGPWASNPAPTPQYSSPYSTGLVGPASLPSGRSWDLSAYMEPQTGQTGHTTPASQTLRYYRTTGRAQEQTGEGNTQSSAAGPGYGPQGSRA